MYQYSALGMRVTSDPTWGATLAAIDKRARDDEIALADWQVKPHCRPSEVANGPWADAAGSMRRGSPRPRGVAEIVYGNRGVFDK